MISMDKITGSLEKAIVENRLPVPLAAVLRAASAFYGAGVAFRNALYDRIPALSHAAPRPVISIGGIRAGGTGKTPVAAMIGAHLASKGIGVAYLSRGYRRKDSSCRIVAPGESVPWSTIGDEPALLHSRLPQSWLGIGPDRSQAAARLAPLLPPRSAYVLDDGFQHRALRRDLDIVCLHESFSADRLIPAGFCREPLSALARARIALIIGPPELAGALMDRKRLLAARFPKLFIAVMFQVPGSWVCAADGRRIGVPPLQNPMLICGIARPGRFTDMIRKAGIIPSATLIFGDHHPYAPDNFRDYRKLLPNGIITTEKDAVRLRSMDVVQLEKMWYLTIDVRFADPGDEIECNSLIDRVIR
jgi:tetraacyldisaccharide 4'-kinase